MGDPWGRRKEKGEPREEAREQERTFFWLPIEKYWNTGWVSDLPEIILGKTWPAVCGGEVGPKRPDAVLRVTCQRLSRETFRKVTIATRGVA